MCFVSRQRSVEWCVVVTWHLSVMVIVLQSVPSQEVVGQILHSSPGCGTSHTCTRHMLCISSSQFLFFSHFYTSHMFLPSQHVMLSTQ